MKRGYVDTAEGQIHYRTEGQGEPVLLLHQTPTSSEEYSLVIPILSPHFRAIAIDTLGYGYSARPSRKLTIEEYALNVLHVLDAFEIKQTNLVGHHTGAVIAIEIAAKYPHRVRKLVISADTGRADRQELAAQWAVSPAFNPEEPDVEGEFLKKKWQLYRSFCMPGTDPKVWYPEFVAALMCGQNLHDGHHAAFMYDLNSKLPLIEAPTLAIVGSKDKYGSDLEYTKNKIPNCETLVIENGGIFMPREIPQEFGKAILDFLLK